MRRIFIGVLFLSILHGCGKESESTEAFRVEYAVTSAWTGYRFSAVFDHSGHLYVTEKNPVAEIDRTFTYPLGANEMESIEERLLTLKDIELLKAYGFGEGKPYDLPITSFRYETTSGSDSTDIYVPEENELPVELASILQTLMRIIQNQDLNADS
ncbi:MAG: hypothetical protein R2751_09960 [Bacteroidales bacterium]